MPWENRHGRRYYYRKKRRGRRVISEYIGAGPGAELIATLDQAEREMTQAERDRWRAEIAEQRRIDRELDRVGAGLRGLVAEALRAAGYHRHKGQWRRKRE